MIVQSTLALVTGVDIFHSPTPRQSRITSPTNAADTVRISKAAREAFAASTASVASPSPAANNDKSVETRLAAIKSKDAMSRSQEDWDYLFANDQKLAEISAKMNRNPASLTAEEVDYDQKARGLINIMANLSPAEKMLYNKAVASGNTEAAMGMSQIGLVRMLGHTAGGTNGTPYDPLDTAITPSNIQKYFSHSIVDPSGKAQSQFQALIQFLQDNSVA